MRTITIIWKCSCLAKEKQFEMREREVGEDVRDWMMDVQEELTAQHAKTSPLCTADKVEWIKFEVEPGEAVGKAKGFNA